MIIFQEKFLTDVEINILLNMWDNRIARFGTGALSFYSIDIKNSKFDITFLHNNAFKKSKFHKIRLQMYNETFEQVTTFHGHENIHNYIIFLNDNFEGGNLEFENGITIKPTRGSLVYFNNNEFHRVHNCIGNRYVFTALGDNEAEIIYNVKQRTELI